MNNSFAISTINKELLDSFRKSTDSVADHIIERITTSGDMQKTNEVMMLLFRNSAFEKGMFDSLGSQFSTILDEYIESTQKLPDWADPDKIKGGEKFFSLYGPEVFMLVNVSSLPLFNTCANGAQVFYNTGRLLIHKANIDPLARRLMDIAQMVVNVFSKGGLSAKGRGIVTIQRVRLIHAFIRYYLKQKHKPFDIEKYGEPINQEDLAGVLMSFGPVIIAGLKRLNVVLTQTHQDGYMHCWKVVGYLMGIDERLLPDSYEDGFELATKILKHQSVESEAGKALTSSYIQFMNYLTPGNALNEVPAYFIDYFLQEFSESSAKNLSTCIGVSDHRDRKDRIILGLEKLIVGKLGHLEEHKFAQKISSYFNAKLLEGALHHFNEGKNVQFIIPPSLQKDWGLVDERGKAITSPAPFGKRLSSQKRMKQADQSKKLEKLIDDKDHIIRILAHDLKNPLANITTISNILKGEHKIDQQKKFIAMIEKVSAQAQGLVNNVLDMATMEDGTLQLKPEILDIKEVVNEVVVSMSEQAKKKGIVISVSGSVAKVKVDHTYLLLIFENLLSNALKFSYKEDRVDIDISADDKIVKVKVMDEGPGIKPEEENQLFKKFVKLSARPTDMENSSGLGLSLVKHYTKQIGGKVWYDRKAAKGATFVVELLAVKDI